MGDNVNEVLFTVYGLITKMDDCKTIKALKSNWTACVIRSGSNNNNNSDNNNNVIIQSTHLYQEGIICPFLFSTFSLRLF